MAAAVVLHLQQTLGSLDFLLGQFVEKFGSHPPGPHSCPGEAQREEGAGGGPQMPADQVIDSGLLWGGWHSSTKSGSSTSIVHWLIGSKEVS